VEDTNTRKPSGWTPSIDGVECGCVIFSRDSQKSYDEWKKCEAHAFIDFSEIKKLVVESNLKNLLNTGEVTVEDANELRQSWYQTHGIKDGL